MSDASKTTICCSICSTAYHVWKECVRDHNEPCSFGPVDPSEIAFHDNRGFTNDNGETCNTSQDLTVDKFQAKTDKKVK